VIFSSKPTKSDRIIHVLVVDDSAVVRQVMQGILSTDPKIKVSVAADPIIALAKIEKDPRSRIGAPRTPFPPWNLVPSR
jgi:CheY-like chemotaxis protein